MRIRIATVETIQALISPFTDLHHRLYMDNYYNIVNNTEAILQKKKKKTVFMEPLERIGLPGA